MNLKEMTKFRHTIKAYDTERSIPQADWDEIVDYMHRSPTSMNWQTWRAVIFNRGSKFVESLTEEEMLVNAKVTKEMDKLVIFISPTHEAYDETDFALERGRNNAMSSGWRTNPDLKLEDITDEQAQQSADSGTSFLGAMGFPDKKSWGQKQAYIALGFGMSAAASMGIDTTAMEGFSPEKLTAKLREAGYINEFETTAVMLGFGYRKDETAFNKSTRVPKNEVFTEVK